MSWLPITRKFWSTPMKSQASIQSCALSTLFLPAGALVLSCGNASMPGGTGAHRPGVGRAGVVPRATARGEGGAGLEVVLGELEGEARRERA